MKPLERIHILVEPYDPGMAAGRPIKPRRTSLEYDRFAAELQQHTTASVDIVERWLAEAPRDGMLLIAYHLASYDKLVADAKDAAPGEPRPLLIAMDSDRAFSLSESIRPAGVVMSDRFDAWLFHAEDDGYPLLQLYGLKALAPALAPVLKSRDLGETEHYCSYIGRVIQSLPALVAHYIDVYWSSLSATGV
jgi:hypothetical protein